MEMILYWMGVIGVVGFIFLAVKLRGLREVIARLLVFDRCNTDDINEHRNLLAAAEKEMARLDEKRHAQLRAEIARLEGYIAREAETRRTADEKLTERINRITGTF